MNYMDFEDWIWFCQFKSKAELADICNALCKELNVPPYNYEELSKDEVIARLDALAVQYFPRAVHAPGMIADLSVVGQLREWWKVKKKELR